MSGSIERDPTTGKIIAVPDKTITYDPKSGKTTETPNSINYKPSKGD